MGTASAEARQPGCCLAAYRQSAAPDDEGEHDDCEGPGIAPPGRGNVACDLGLSDSDAERGSESHGKGAEASCQGCGESGNDQQRDPGRVERDAERGDECRSERG